MKTLQNVPFENAQIRYPQALKTDTFPNDLKGVRPRPYRVISGIYQIGPGLMHFTSGTFSNPLTYDCVGSITPRTSHFFKSLLTMGAILFRGMRLRGSKSFAMCHSWSSETNMYARSPRFTRCSLACFITCASSCSVVRFYLEAVLESSEMKE